MDAISLLADIAAGRQSAGSAADKPDAIAIICTNMDTARLTSLHDSGRLFSL